MHRGRGTLNGPAERGINGKDGMGGWLGLIMACSAPNARRPAWTAVALLIGSTTLGCAARGMRPPPHRFEYIRLSMGVPARIVLYAPDPRTAGEAAAAAYAVLSRLDEAMSDYRADSELMRLCDRAGGPPTAVSDDLFAVLERAAEVSGATDGAFDVTAGPCVALWRASRRTGRLPGDGELAAARALVGWRGVVLDTDPLGPRRAVRLMTPGMRLDLGGIAKGYAAERAVQALRQRGAERCMVALAGDIAVGAPPPGEDGWCIEVAGGQTPEDDTAAGGGGSWEDEVDGEAPPPRPVLRLANAAVSTSGDTEQFVVIDGRRYAHMVDPRTGLGLARRMSATVVADHGDLADALATAVCIAGPDRADDILASFPHVAAVIEWIDDAGVLRRAVLDPDGRLRRPP